MLKGFYTFLLLIFSLTTFGAETDPVITSIDIPVQISSGSEEKLSPDEAMELSFQDISNAGTTDTDIYFWVRFDLSGMRNVLNQYSDWYLTTSPMDYATLYTQKGTDWIERDYGYLSPLSDYRKTIHSFQVKFSTDELIDGRYLILRIRKVASFYDLRNFKARITEGKKFESEQERFTWGEVSDAIPDFMFVGAALIAMFYALALYVWQRRSEFLYYSLYLLMLLIYLGRRPLRIHDLLFGMFPIGDWIVHMQSQIAINLFYVLFVRYFLNTRNDYQPLDKAIRWIILFLIGTMILDLFFISTQLFSAHIHLMNFHRLVMSLFALGGSVYLILKRKDYLVYFIVAGSILFTSGALATLFTADNIFMIIGTTLEIITFGTGLGFKLRQTYVQNRELENTAILMEINALKAQMNPHFIFNSLASIQHLISSNDRRSSLRYLSKFSTLLRQILDSSVDSSNLLVKEIELLQNYIELESLRFSGDFAFEIKVDDNLDIHTVEVPVFVVQPFVENAIIHGLKSSVRQHKSLIIEFHDENNYVTCVITDNGIGRDAARKNAVKRRSHGMTVTLKRLAMADSGSDAELVSVEDLHDEANNPIGTRVTIKIPKLLT